MRKAVTLAFASAVFASSLLLSGCTINIGSTDTNQHMGMMDEHGADLSGADIMFAQMMIPHHQQAVDMGTLAETRAFSPEVKALAAKIKAEQAPEIAEMKHWLEDANAPLEMGHDMGMGGMLTESQMAALAAASGAEFDKLYLNGMIGHHEGAIHMAQMILDSDNATVKALGESIVKSQTEQINYMKDLLAK